MNERNYPKGITLIELLIVIAIIGILAAIAIPSYNGQMQRARRADAKTALEQLRASQEMRRAERGSYSNSLVELVNTWGAQSQTGGTGGVPDYVILINSFSAATSSYVGVAQANSARQLSDGDLTINQNGTKLPADKWAK